MTSEATSPSRLGLTLQGYDQVVAFSQSHINESLKYKYKVNKNLQSINYTDGVQGTSMEGTLKPATVALVDTENGDQVIFLIRFETGHWNKNKGANKLSYDLGGWSFAFVTDLSMTTLNTIPNEIKSAIHNPDLFSVSQLMLQFTTRMTNSLSWKHSITPGFSEQTSSVCGSLEHFIRNYLLGIFLADPKNSILGYVACAKQPENGQSELHCLKMANQQAPTLVPTSLRLQTINHRPGGDVAKASQTEGKNAFLFTLMTEYKDLPKSDLQWSGDWFYKPMGGTLAMSKNNFIDRFLAPNIHPLVSEVWGLSDKILQKIICNHWSYTQGSCDYPRHLHGPTTKPIVPGSDLWSAYDHSASGAIRGTRPSKQFIPSWDNSTRVIVRLQPQPGSGTINVHVTAKSQTKYVSEEIPFYNFEQIWDIECKLDYVASIKLKAVDANGQLSVQTGLHNRDISYTVSGPEKDLREFPPIGIFGHELRREENRRDEETYFNARRDEVKELIYGFMEENRVVSDMKPRIEEGLDKQTKFIFPGSGKFHMKDPIFSNSGDLLLGLTYMDEKWNIV